MEKYFLILLLSIMSFAAESSERASGNFSVSKKCDAFLSMAKGTNPGNVKAIPGAVYEIKEVSKNPNFEWVRVDIPDINESLRWVPVECGIIADLKINVVSEAVGHNNNLCQTPDLYDSHVLAMSWQPGFCEHPAHPEKVECAKMASGELAITNLTLHGLWPNKKECGTKYAGCGNSPLNLSDETISTISPWMPNFFYETTFGSYEWKKHGTCQTTRSSDEYFNLAVSAVKVVDASPIGKKIKGAIGKSVTKKELVDAAKSVDPSLANSIAFLCNGKYLVEIRVRLPKEIKVDGDLRTLIGPLPEKISNISDECSDGEILIEASGS